MVWEVVITAVDVEGKPDTFIAQFEVLRQATHYIHLIAQSLELRTVSITRL